MTLEERVINIHEDSFMFAIGVPSVLMHSPLNEVVPHSHWANLRKQRSRSFEGNGVVCLSDVPQIQEVPLRGQYNDFHYRTDCSVLLYTNWWGTKEQRVQGSGRYDGKINGGTLLNNLWNDEEGGRQEGNWSETAGKAVLSWEWGTVALSLFWRLNQGEPD